MRALIFALALAPLTLLAQDPHAGQKIKWMTMEEAQAAGAAPGAEAAQNDAKKDGPVEADYEVVDEDKK